MCRTVGHAGGGLRGTREDDVDAGDVGVDDALFTKLSLSLKGLR